jgi:presenilin 1
VATLYILILYGKALPALPISVFLAIVVYFASRELLEPMLDEMTMDVVFI